MTAALIYDFPGEDFFAAHATVKIRLIVNALAVIVDKPTSD
jgi:hypothetical protein